MNLILTEPCVPQMFERTYSKSVVYILQHMAGLGAFWF